MSQPLAPKPERERWLHHADWIVRFIERLKDEPSPHGLKWTFNMLEHYVGKYHNHLDQVPRGCKAHADAYTKRVIAVLEWAQEQA